MLRTNYLLSLKEAADQLGYSRSGLQKIVDNTKQRGPRPYIRFLQTGKGARIKFLPEWIEEFIEANSHELSGPTVVNPYTPPRKSKTFSLDLSRLDAWPS